MEKKKTRVEEEKDRVRKKKRWRTNRKKVREEVYVI